MASATRWFSTVSFASAALAGVAYSSSSAAGKNENGNSRIGAHFTIVPVAQTAAGREAHESSAKSNLPCETPACKTRTTQFRDALLATSEGKRQKSQVVPSHPPSREELGRATWTLLHTVAAYYPKTPTEIDKKHAVALINSLAHLYPCADCAAEFQETLKRSQPDVSSRESFSRWLCEYHNSVSERLGKPKSQLAPCDDIRRILIAYRGEEEEEEEEQERA